MHSDQNLSESLLALRVGPTSFLQSVSTQKPTAAYYMADLVATDYAETRAVAPMLKECADKGIPTDDPEIEAPEMDAIYEKHINRFKVSRLKALGFPQLSKLLRLAPDAYDLLVSSGQKEVYA